VVLLPAMAGGDLSHGSKAGAGSTPSEVPACTR
jgi:hypothetical protein